MESEQRPSPERVDQERSRGAPDRLGLEQPSAIRPGQTAPGQNFPGYEQERWVRWADLIDLWRAYNTHILHVVGCMSEEGKCATCRVGGGAEVTLAGLFVDYVDHLEHHLRKMLGGWESEPT